ncbi:MAG TPA: HDOD domain-containing protein [Acidimicrobiales bacterium]|nr:HDOD domain-containing protein [Acidimicrobiales bacterium]
MTKFMVGRQPIFDARLAVVGYELLFRDDQARPCGDAMTANVLVHSCLDLGLNTLVGDKLAFVNTTRSYLVGENEIPFPPRQTVVDILEDVPRDSEVIAGCRRLAQNGYTLAADGRFQQGVDPLLELVSMIKVDVFGLEARELPSAVMYCSAYGVKLVAKRVETRDQLRACQRLGFDLFQGYLLSRPETVEGQSLNPSKLACLRILDKLCDPATSAEQIEDIVKTDAALSYRFLRMAGAGAARGLSRRLSSVREGVVLIGHRRLRAWVMLMLLSENYQSGCEEQLVIAMTRAKMAENIAAKLQPALADRGFTVGLISGLDMLLALPMAEVVAQLSLTPDVEEAVLQGTGALGDILADVRAWEVGDNRAVRCGLAMDDVASTYVHALRWATETTGALEAAS